MTPQLDWRLSGFDLVSEHNTVASYDSPIRYASRLVSSLPAFPALGDSMLSTLRTAEASETGLALKLELPSADN